MTIQQIQYVLEVYRCGSISGAAKKLHVAQPNLSNAVRALEEDLGFTLFSRSVRGAAPTEKGLLALAQVGQIWDAYEKMLQIVHLDSIHQLRILGVPFLPVRKAYVELCAQAAQLEGADLSYTFLDLDTSLERLRTSQADLVISIVAEELLNTVCAKCKSLGLTLFKLFKTSPVLRIGENHPLYKKADISPLELMDYPLMDCGETGLMSVLPGIPSRRIQVGDSVAREELLKSGAFVSLCYAVPDKYNTDIRSIPLEGGSSWLVSIRKNDQPENSLMNRFLEILDTCLG